MFDTFQEHCDYEANARYDYVSEAWGELARDCNEMARDDEAFEYEQEVAYRMDCDGLTREQAEDDIRMKREAEEVADRLRRAANLARDAADFDELPF